MRALVFDGARLRLEERPKPAPAGEALVRVRLAGVCRTDLEIVRGYKGFRGILGHEFVGELPLPEGGGGARRVVADINVGCPECADARHCKKRTVLGILGRDGVFAEWVRVPHANLHTVPSHVPDRQAVFAEPLAAALAVVPLLQQDDVLVVGDGRLGALIAMALQAKGFPTFLVGRHPDKLRHLAGLGLRTGTWEDVRKRRWTQGVEASGSTQVPGELIDLLEPRGRIVLKTTGVERASLDLSTLVVKEMQLLGSRCGLVSEAIDLMATANLPLEGLISHVVPLGEEALNMDGFKTLIEI